MIKLIGPLLLIVALAGAACSSDSPVTSTDDPGESSADDTGTDSSGDDGDAGGLPNACPSEGCEVFVVDAEATDDGELSLTFEANFTPDFERNHIHVFWDTQEPGAVSSDFESKGFEVQGKWHPTDEYPVYVTQADASTSADSRGDSTTVCVTAADTDHAVLDAGIFACRDVADQLSS